MTAYNFGTFERDQPQRNMMAMRNMLLAALNHSLNGQVRVLQVGANDGVLADPIAGAIADWDWTALMYEPHPVYYADLEEKYRDSKTVRTRNLGISDRPGTLTLHYLDPQYAHIYPAWAKGCASMNRDRIVGVFSPVEGSDPHHVIDIEVSVDRLDTELRAQDFRTFDLLVLDVEGHELQVLRSFDLHATGALAALVECNGPDVDKQGDYVAALEQAGMMVFRAGIDLLALRPGALSLPVESMLEFMKLRVS